MGHGVLCGRTKIYTDVSEVTSANVLSVLNAALPVHQENRNEIQILYDYYRGKTDIFCKIKETRSNINNKINENRANEIVNFKLGYLFGEPVTYIRRGDDADVTEDINQLNEFMFAEDKASKDKEIGEWMLICGVGRRMLLPNRDGDVAENPFEVYTLDPRNSFVVYNNDLEERPVMGVRYVKKSDGRTVYSVYTPKRFFNVTSGARLGGLVVSEEMENPIGDVPIVEYLANNAQLGAFEIVLTILDAINNVQSMRLDDVEQFVNAIMVFLGCDVDEKVLEALKGNNAISIPPNCDMKLLTAALQQADTQVLADALYEDLLTICGMPNRNGSTSTSDTGAAVIYRDGWSAAETQAKSMELMFKKSEKQFLRQVLKICKTFGRVDLKLSDIEIKFSRRNTENLLTKTQALIQLLEAGVSPEIAVSTCGLWSDPLDVYSQSEPYLKRWEYTEEPSVGDG